MSTISQPNYHIRTSTPEDVVGYASVASRIQLAEYLRYGLVGNDTKVDR